MTEEIVSRIVCDKCGHTEETQAQAGFFGVKKPRYPQAWGRDLLKQNTLCPKCIEAYHKGYEKWYSDFMKGK